MALLFSIDDDKIRPDSAILGEDYRTETQTLGGLDSLGQVNFSVQGYLGL